ncbi:MAG: MBL fold metallo-hydrolase [Spirochaetes bacterium]|nr:MBL fold metallo-hydrolase [Spirochaetota bacterium]
MKKKGHFTEIHPDIYRLTLPLPGRKPGPIHVYLFLGEIVTLLDTGTLRTAGLLRNALGELGLSFSDIRQIVITHGHPDHCGAARRIGRAKGGRVSVAAHAREVHSIETGFEVSKKTIAMYLKMMGVPWLFRQSVRLIALVFKFLSSNCRVDALLRDGNVIRLGNYDARVVSTPGHTAGSISLFIENEKIIFTGDTVLSHITPNAFVILDHYSILSDRLSQEEFYNSLSKIEALGPSIIYPSHGEEIVNLRELVEQYRICFAEREKSILSILSSGEKSIYQTARRLFPDVAWTRWPLEIYLSVSEAYTHAQVLRKHNKIRIRTGNNRLLARLA